MSRQNQNGNKKGFLQRDHTNFLIDATWLIVPVCMALLPRDEMAVYILALVFITLSVVSLQTVLKGIIARLKETDERLTRLIDILCGSGTSSNARNSNSNTGARNGNRMP